MPEIIEIRVRCLATTCFLNLESIYLKYLVLISPRLAREGLTPPCPLVFRNSRLDPPPQPEEADRFPATPHLEETRRAISKG